MKSKIIVMLTKDDKTVDDAIDIFKLCIDLPIDLWGFKNIGLSSIEMQQLIQEVRGAGKTSFLEIVSYSKEECMDGAVFAVENRFNYLMGTIFYKEVWEFLSDKDINYFPFVGKVHGSPSVLEGTAESMIEQAESYANFGVHGIDLLAFRHAENPIQLAGEFINKCKIPTILAGSIDSYEKLLTVSVLNPWAFTMGSALFNKQFIPEGSFLQNLEQVLELMNLIE